jgi:hypothetical protein
MMLLLGMTQYMEQLNYALVLVCVEVVLVCVEVVLVCVEV